MLSKINLSGVSFDSYTYISALKVCINLLNLRLEIQVHGLVITDGYELDSVVGSFAVDLYAKLGKIKEVSLLFHRLPQTDIVAWSALIMGCAKLGFNSLVFMLFRDMVNLSLEVDQYVISSVLKVCSSSAALGSGKQVHAFCIKNGYETEGGTITALIDMYGKCDEIEHGLALFNSILDWDVVCQTGVIVGCGQNGRAIEAVELYRKMIDTGLKPNEVTFLGVLTACRHAGFTEEAQTIFKSMKFDYGLEPQIEHYYCLIDLLGQARRLKDAEKSVAEMPFKHDRTIHRSLLGACGTHKNTELVSAIEKNLLATSPDDPSVYVILSNTYTTDSLGKVREAAKKLGTKKAGKSWIEI